MSFLAKTISFLLLLGFPLSGLQAEPGKTAAPSESKLPEGKTLSAELKQVLWEKLYDVPVADSEGSSCYEKCDAAASTDCPIKKECAFRRSDGTPFSPGQFEWLDLLSH